MSRFNVKFLPEHVGDGFVDNLMPTLSAARTDFVAGLAMLRAAVSRVAPPHFSISASPHLDTLTAEVWRRNPSERANFTTFSQQTRQTYGGLVTPLPPAYFADPPYSPEPHATTPEPSVASDGQVSADNLTHVLLLSLFWDHPELFEPSAADPYALNDLQRDFASGVSLCENAVHRVAAESPFSISDRDHRRDIAGTTLAWEPSTVWSSLTDARADELALQNLTNFKTLGERVNFERLNQQSVNARYVGLLDASDALTGKTEFARLLREADCATPGAPTAHELESHQALVASTDATTRRREIYRLRQRLIRAGRGGNAPFIYEAA